ncbi:exodeoxyribonuclease VII large subunit [Acidithrix sp. C25]|uniref:exodeoxyribonuclease VII large subunit n=1 Tax=Acidithrix sp. C25 TaxID=1671482 RepID=UPI00191BB46A|nr:exodeoxyribonuclease VII large subunit [Acidithrix sp. C25]CAG4931434.1 unnamed protein product [Acidithrix sp. C25]
MLSSEIGTYSVGSLLDTSKALLSSLGSSREPFRVEGFVSFNATTAKYDQMYLSLCQYADRNSPVGKPIAKLDAVIFQSQLKSIKASLATAQMALVPDLRAVFFGHIDIYKPFGKLQLVIVGVDIERTRQIAEGAKDLLRRRLKEEGIFDLNRGLKAPLVPLRIALVTSRGSAAESDFVTRLDRTHYKFLVTPFYVNTSGQNVAFSIPEAMARINERSHDFDIVVLARGGGDHVDLASFSLEGPTRSVATCKVPVWAAIGHSTDDVLVNEVSNKALSNPNDAASELNRMVFTFHLRLKEAVSNANSFAQERIEIARSALVTQKYMVFAGASRQLGGHKQAISRAGWNLGVVAWDSIGEISKLVASAGERVALGRDDLLRHSRALLESASSQLDWNLVERMVDDPKKALARLDRDLLYASTSSIERFRSQLLSATLLLNSIDPKSILALGYAIVEVEGKVANEISKIRAKGKVTVTMKDGKFNATVSSVSSIN